jgi:outer membrane protein assembly factor BamB
MRRTLISLVSLPVSFLLLGASSAALPQDWPRWRGANFNDASQETEVFTEAFELRVAWRAPVGSGYSAVSIGDGFAVTLASRDGSDFVVALDARTGEERWRHRISAAFPGRDGANDGPVSTPTIHEGAVYALGPFGHFLALDLATGKDIWSTHLVEEHGSVQPHWGFTTAPLVAGANVIVQTGGPAGHAITAFFAATGDVHWSTGTDKIEYQSPILTTQDGVEQVIGCGEKWLFGLDPGTGAQLWKFDHQGSDFYRRIVNPLMIEDELLFLKNRASESILLSVGTEADGFPIEPLWATRAIKQNYNMAVYHDGHLYGHNGSFLTCINTYDGERAWRSRPPGNGWVILVDGHLVVLTKAGSLHVVPATPDGYEELASMQLFERLTWTPPSFAGGRIYARDSFDDVACVEVVSVEKALMAAVAPGPGGVGVGPGVMMQELEELLAEAEDPGVLIDEFLAAQESFPVIEGDRIAHVVFRGEAEELTLRGDMVGDGEMAMRRVAGSDLFAASFELEPDARVGYQLVRGFDEVLTDPRNPRKTEAQGLGVMSELVMPACKEIQARKVEQRGTFESFQIDSARIQVGGMTWGGGRRIDVYLPPGYQDGDESYPVIYVNDGADAMAKLRLPAVLDQTIGRSVGPVIAVFIQRVSAYELARSQRDAYRAMVVSQIVPEVDDRYRTIAAPEARSITGYQEGGCGALFVALSHPDVFGSVGVQSVYLGSMQNRSELKALANELGGAGKLPDLYLDWGIYDPREAVKDIDTVRFSRWFAELTRSHGGRVSGGEYSDGANFNCWHARQPSLLASLFPLRRTPRSD